MCRQWTRWQRSVRHLTSHAHLTTPPSTTAARRRHPIPPLDVFSLVLSPHRRHLQLLPPAHLASITTHRRPAASPALRLCLCTSPSWSRPPLLHPLPALIARHHHRQRRRALLHGLDRVAHLPPPPARDSHFASPLQCCPKSPSTRTGPRRRSTRRTTRATISHPCSQHPSHTTASNTMSSRTQQLPTTASDPRQRES